MPKLRLVAASCLFVGWLGYLAYLVSATRNPVILSRPQFLAADLYVLAELSPATDKNPSAKVTIKKIYWSKEPADLLDGKEITVESLDKCQLGWIGVGLYIVPLTKTLAGFRLTEIPISPGFHHQEKPTINYLRIYPKTEQAQEQVQDLTREYHK